MNLEEVVSMAESTGFFVGVGSALATLLAYLGWESRNTNKQLQELPEKYVLKHDYIESNRIIRDEMHEIKTTLHDGLNRIHSRLDKQV